MTYALGSLVEGTISKIAFGGNGILRTEDNFVIFVPFTAPQDKIICRITKVKKGYAEAELVELLNSSPFRIEPKCPYFGQCGGCQLQHITYSEQLQYKGEAIQDAIRKFAHLQKPYSFTIHPARLQWYYRRHIHLTLKACDKGYLAGYIQADHHSFLPVKECPIFVLKENSIIADIQETISTLLPFNEDGKVMVVKMSNEDFLLHFHFKDWSKQNYKLLEKAKNKYPKWKSLLVSSTTKSAGIGEDKISTEVGPYIASYTSSAFMQNHPEESVKIYLAIASIAKQMQPTAILDLYCGIGISCLFLAEIASVLGIEENHKAIQMANWNAENNQFKNITYKIGKVENLLPHSKKADFVLINPPRTGLEKKVIEVLMQQQPKNIVYVSCMPSTLARDLKSFLDNGYEIIECQAFDMFPQTAHVETLVHLQRISRH